MVIASHFEQQINKDGIKKRRVKVAMTSYFQLDKLLCLRKSVTGKATRIRAAQEIDENWSPNGGRERALS